jgi:hypothetical protein
MLDARSLDRVANGPFRSRDIFIRVATDGGAKSALDDLTFRRRRRGRHGEIVLGGRRERSDYRNYYKQCQPSDSSQKDFHAARHSGWPGLAAMRAGKCGFSDFFAAGLAGHQLSHWFPLPSTLRLLLHWRVGSAADLVHRTILRRAAFEQVMARRLELDRALEDSRHVGDHVG